VRGLDRWSHKNSDSWNGWDGRSVVNIDGFGAVGAPWPSGLPRALYWTGTEGPYFPGDLPGSSWFVGPGGPGGSGFGSDNVRVDSYNRQNIPSQRVVCVR